MAVATRLGEPGEVVARLDDVAALAAGDFDHRSVVVLTHGPAAGSPGVAPRGRTGGRPVDDFAHRRGMITKPEVRSVVLGRLDLPERDLAWLAEGTPEFDRYIAELRWAQHFALLNREEMMDRVAACLARHMRVDETP